MTTAKLQGSTDIAFIKVQIEKGHTFFGRGRGKRCPSRHGFFSKKTWGIHVIGICNLPFITSWWLNQPIEKYAHQIGSFPQVGVKIHIYLKPPPSLPTFTKAGAPTKKKTHHPPTRHFWTLRLKLKRCYHSMQKRLVWFAPPEWTCYRPRCREQLAVSKHAILEFFVCLPCKKKRHPPLTNTCT